MATKTKRGPRTLSAGPFTSVLNTRDPGDGNENVLVDALNMYFAAPDTPAGCYARPGFVLQNGGNAVYTSGSAFRGQGIHSHTNLDGTTINFIAMGGHLFRVDPSLSIYTDVTPVGVTIDPAVTTRVYFLSLIGTLMVTDGVNRPWIATNLNSTPITGTYIDYDGAGVSWSTYGRPVQYGGSAIVILAQVNGIARRADISWCEPGLLSLGWQQPTFDDNWTLTQNEGGVLYGLAATNTALYYFRAMSIGSASGEPGPDFASTATEDAIGFNVGTEASQTIMKYGNTIAFCDALGRPYAYRPGQAPIPLWKQMRTIIDASTSAFPSTTAIVATSAFEGTLNKFLFAIYSPTPSTQAPPIEIQVFDGETLKYEGRWNIGPGIGIECLGTFVDSSGRSTLIVLGSKLAAPAVGGYVWSFNALIGLPDALATEGGVLLTTEGGVQLTTEGQNAVWQDNGQIPFRAAKTDRLGFDEDVVWNVDRCTVVTLNDTPVQVLLYTANASAISQGIPTPSTSQDGTFRLVVGCDGQGRGPQVVVSPTTADEQWVLERISLKAVPSLAGPEDA